MIFHHLNLGNLTNGQKKKNIRQTSEDVHNVLYIRPRDARLELHRARLVGAFVLRARVQRRLPFFRSRTIFEPGQAGSVRAKKLDALRPFLFLCHRTGGFSIDLLSIYTRASSGQQAPGIAFFLYSFYAQDLILVLVGACGKRRIRTRIEFYVLLLSNFDTFVQSS